MKNLTILALIFVSLVSKGQCTYDENNIPGVVKNNEVLCIKNDKTIPWGSLNVDMGGLIVISDSSTFTFSGSLTVSPGGNIHFMDCKSKVVVPYGGYTGGNSEDCEMKVYNCDSPVNPFTIDAGSVAFQDWCKIETEILPVEVISTSIDCKSKTIYWSTAAEINNKFFTVYHSDNAKDWESTGAIIGQGNSSKIVKYNYFAPETGYYKITQTDFDGTTKEFKRILYCNKINDLDVTLVTTYDFLGKVVGNDTKGLVIELYSDGTTKKVVR